MKIDESVLGMTHSRPLPPLPDKACDCHVHVFGPYETYPLAANRSYTPGHATVEDLQKHQAILGLKRVVLVQPSVYGTDNSCLLHALKSLGPTVARGIAVVDQLTSPGTLYELKSAGVVGIRLNLASVGANIKQARDELAFAKKWLL